MCDVLVLLRRQLSFSPAPTYLDKEEHFPSDCVHPLDNRRYIGEFLDVARHDRCVHLDLEALLSWRCRVS